MTIYNRQKSTVKSQTLIPSTFILITALYYYNFLNLKIKLRAVDNSGVVL